MFSLLRDMLMDALLLGNWQHAGARRDVVAVDGSTIHKGEFMEQRWHDGRWEHRRLPADEQDFNGWWQSIR